MEEQRKQIIIKNEKFILKEAYIDSDGDTIWDVQDQQTEQSFVVHSTATGNLYINFFRNMSITTECSYNAIHKICEILLERDLKPTINIYYKNTHLIKLCCAIGFRKVRDVKHLYYLKNLK